MSGGGGGYSGMLRNVYNQLPQNMGGTGTYPGMQQGMGQGVTTPGYEQAYNTNYGQLGSYNTLAQDLANQQTGAFAFGQGGMPFQYQAGQGPGGRPGVSGYTGIGPFQNQGGGAIPTGMQTSLGTGSQAWPGFGMGGQPGRYGRANMGGYGGGYYGGAYGGGGYGQQGSPFFYGPGSYSSPGSMPYGGGGGFSSGYFDRARQQGYQQPFTPGQRRPGSPTGIVIGGGNPVGGGMATTGQESLPPGMQNPRSVRPAQEIQPWLNYRSPFSGGGRFTQYKPELQQVAMW